MERVAEYPEPVIYEYAIIEDVLETLLGRLMIAEAGARMKQAWGTKRWTPANRKAYDRLTRSLMLRRQTAELAKIADSLGLELCYTLRQKAAVSDASE